MRGSPPCEVALRRFGVWRTAIALIGLSVLATLCTWTLLTPQGPTSQAVMATAAIAALATVASCASLWWPATGTLRWDGLAWTFTTGSAEAEPAPGEIGVSLDLGSFMLLRFAPAASASTRARRRWLPVQRRGLERDWHSFRCAVYSPRPAALSPGGDITLP